MSISASGKIVIMANSPSAISTISAQVRGKESQPPTPIGSRKKTPVILPCGRLQNQVNQHGSLLGEMDDQAGI